MVVEAVQNYVNMVNGLTRMTREKALSTARALLAQAGLEDVANDAGGRVTKLAEEIILANRANRELVENLISAEVDKAAARWGFVRTDDVEALREEIAELRVALIRATTKRPNESAEPAAAPRRGRRTSAATTTAQPASQQPPLGGRPSESGVTSDHPELVPSEPLPYEPGPIQSTADRATGSAAETGPRTSRRSPTSTPAAAKKSAAKKSAAKTSATKKSTPAPADPETRTTATRKAGTRKAATRTAGPPEPDQSTPVPSPVADGDVAE
jgi:hypothetical protein